MGSFEPLHWTTTKTTKTLLALYLTYSIKKQKFQKSKTCFLCLFNKHNSSLPGDAYSPLPREALGTSYSNYIKSVCATYLTIWTSKPVAIELNPSLILTVGRPLKEAMIYSSKMATARYGAAFGGNGRESWMCMLIFQT